MMNSVTKKKWKSLVAIAKKANEFSGKTGDSYDGRGYFPNKNMSTAVAKSLTRDAKTQGKALVTKMESHYDNEVDWNKGTRYLNVPKNMIKHEVEDRFRKSAGTHYINTENKMKYIFGENKMKKSDFKKLLQSIIYEVVDVLEGKGDAPGATRPSPGKATPSQISKGGFTLKDFSSVLGGVGGRVRTGKGTNTSREKGTPAGKTYSGRRKETRMLKLALFRKTKTIDSWRSEVLGGGDKFFEKGKYQRNIIKSKDTSSTIDTLASIRNSDDAFRKSGGGRKPGGRESFKVSAKYISGKGDALKIYNETIDGEIAKLRAIQQDASAGDKNYVALENLIEDLGLKKDEYALRWDYASAAYSGNTSAMAAARSNIEAKRDVILKRAKSVGGADKEDDKDKGGGGTSTWEEGGQYNWGDNVKAEDGSTWKATNYSGKEDSRDLSDVNPLDGEPIWVKQ